MRPKDIRTSPHPSLEPPCPAPPTLGSTRWRCTPAQPPTRPPARAPCRSTCRPRSCSTAPSTRRRCSTPSARATSTAASPTRPTRCSKSAWPRWKAVWAPSPPPAARRRCTWRCARWPAPAATSSPPRRCTAARTTCCITRWRVSASRPPSSPRATWTPGAAPSDPRRVCCSARPWAIPDWTCSTSRRWPRWRTSTSCRCWWTRPSPRPGSCARSSTARTWSTTPRRSSCAATARSWAVCSSTAARSTGPQPTSARGATPNWRSRTRVFTVWCSPRRARWGRFCCARGARGCATSAPA